MAESTGHLLGRWSLILHTTPFPHGTSTSPKPSPNFFLALLSRLSCAHIVARTKVNHARQEAESSGRIDWPLQQEKIPWDGTKSHDKGKIFEGLRESKTGHWYLFPSHLG
jgi:hypothetical protein